MADLKDKIVLVTGASGGIGGEVVREPLTTGEAVRGVADASGSAWGEG